MAQEEADLDVMSLLQPRQGYLWKLGGGQEKGSKWNKRWFVLRDNVLMYFSNPKEFSGFRDKPSGVVLLEECNVRGVDQAQSDNRPFQFSLIHNNGEETIVLAAESEKDMLEWMQAVRTSRMCITDDAAARQSDAERSEAAHKELESARDRRNVSEEALREIEASLDTVHAEHRQLDVDKEKAEKELKELMARFKLRKALLHWRHRKLTLSFRSLISMVFKDRIDVALRTKAVADKKLDSMKEEHETSVLARKKAEAAKRKSDEMLTKELQLKKECESASREALKVAKEEAEKTKAAMQAVTQLEAEGAAQLKIDTKEKEDVMGLLATLQEARAEAERLQMQLKLKVTAKEVDID